MGQVYGGHYHGCHNRHPPVVVKYNDTTAQRNLCVGADVKLVEMRTVDVVVFETQHVSKNKLRRTHGVRMLGSMKHDSGAERTYTLCETS